MRDRRWRRRVGDEDAERRRGGMKTMDGHEQPGGEIMQREMRRKDDVKGELKRWSARWKVTL